VSSFWVYDTPMVNGDPFISLALCAKATSRIKLGLGVTSPALRSAPAAAVALSSLNAIAPGRVICGIGTGNTACRTLGMLPVKMAELERFTRALQDLTAGKETEYAEGDRSRTIRFLQVGPYVNTQNPVEFVVAAFGLKAGAIAGRRGAGLSSFGLLAPGVWKGFVDVRRAAAREAGQPESAGSYVVTSPRVLAGSNQGTAISSSRRSWTRPASSAPARNCSNASRRWRRPASARSSYSPSSTRPRK
jgi:5,10-methylenetetrahydromethanopterin reductase